MHDYMVNSILLLHTAFNFFVLILSSTFLEQTHFRVVYIFFSLGHLFS